METLNKYVTLKYKYVQRNRDNENQHKSEETSLQIPVKECELEDFGDDPDDAMLLFKRWSGYFLVCPDLDKSEVDIEGDPGTDKSKYLMFQISLCEQDCAEDTLIHDYI